MKLGAGSSDLFISKYLEKRVKDYVGYRVVKKVKTARSHGNNLVQLADMISGVVCRSFKQQDNSYRELGFRQRIESPSLAEERIKNPLAYPSRERTPYGASSASGQFH